MDAVSVACGSDVRAKPVYSTVNQEASGVGGSTHVPSDGLAIVVEEYHVAGFQEGEVLCKRILRTVAVSCQSS